MNAPGVAERAIGWVARAQSAVAGVTLLLMLALTVGNVLLRALATPLFGTVELVGLMAAVVTGLALADTQRHHTHIAIDLLMSRRSPRTQLVVSALVTAVAAALFALVGWQLVRYGWNLRTRGAVTDSLRLPYWPVVLALSFGFAGLVLALLGDLLAIARNLRSERPEATGR